MKAVEVKGHAYLSATPQNIMVKVAVEMSLEHWQQLHDALKDSEGNWFDGHKRLLSVVKSVLDKFNQKVVEAQEFKA